MWSIIQEIRIAEQAYSYYKYLNMQMEYKIKCKEYEKMCASSGSPSMRERMEEKR